MKKLMMLAAFVMMSVAAMAQAGTQAVGVGLNYGTKSGYSPFGVGVKYQNEFVKNIRGEVAFNYYFPKDIGYEKMSFYDINANFHYLFQLAPKFNFYPAVGLSYESAHVSMESMSYEDDDIQIEVEGGSNTEHKLGVNLGGGIEYYLGNSLKVNAEVKYQTWVKWVTIGVGLSYVF